MNFLSLVLNIGLVLLGFVFLIKGADIFVDGSSNIARHFKVSDMIIGLTLVAFGTSLPELAVSLTAALGGKNGIAVGNVVGSNIFNMALILGLISLFKPVDVNPSLLKRDLPLNVVSAVLIFLLTFDTLLGRKVDYISRIDGFILLAFFMWFMYYTIRTALKQRNSEEKHEEDKKFSMIKNILFIVIGIAGIICGGNFVVNGSSAIAKMFGLSDALIGLTIVSIGTSLPELVTSLVALVKGKDDIAVGNVVGSNIFNALYILGMSTAISPITMAPPSLIIDIIILIVISILLYAYSAKKSHLINRYEGISFLAIYIGYTIYIILRG